MNSDKTFYLGFLLFWVALATQITEAALVLMIFGVILMLSYAMPEIIKGAKAIIERLQK